MSLPHFIILPVRAKRFGIPYWRKQAFFFNMSAWMDFYDEFGWDMDLVRNLGQGELTAKMVYHGARHGNFRQNKPFKLTFAELTRQVAKMERESGALLDKTFLESSTVMQEKMTEISKGSKKK